MPSDRPTDQDRDVDFRRAVRDGYDDLADAYAERRSEGDAAGLALLDDLLDGLDTGARLLDVGCGGGDPFLARVAATDGVDVVGFDVSHEQVRRAAAHAPSVQGDMTSLPFTDASFDALTAFYSVIHVPKETHADVYREFHRILRAEGSLLVTSGSAAWEGENPDWLDSGTEMRWSFPGPETTRRHLSDAGFDVERVDELDDSLGGTFCHFRARA